MDILTLKLSPRDVVGKKVKRLRQNGVVPVHYYGAETEALPMQVEDALLRQILPQAGTNVPISIDIEGVNGENICFVREVQRHPVTEDILHVDFLRVDISHIISADVPIILEGDAPAAIEQGGILLQTLNVVRVEALPMNMPASFKIDVSILDDFDKTIRVAALISSDDVTILADPESMITTVVRPRIEEEPVEEKELLEGEEIEGEQVEGEEPQESEESE